MMNKTMLDDRQANRELGESEERFRRMLDALPAAVYATDAEGRLTFCNRAAAEFSGCVPELGTDRWCVTWKLYYPDGRPMPHDECPMAIALKEGRIIYGAEAIAERPDGTRVWFQPYPTLLRDAGGRIVGGINMLVDITERKKADEAMAALNAQLCARANELSNFNRAAVNRELRIVELKAEVNDLRQRLGEAPAYSVDSKPTSDDMPPGVRLPSEEGERLAPLDAVIRTDLLQRRPARPPDYESETRALAALVQALADSPRTILQALADKLVEVMHADSAGLSLLTRDGKRFYWAAISGEWSPHRGGGTPRDFGPCGDVLNCETPLLFTRWERRYPYLSAATPLADEALLVPFYVGGKAVGTIWAIAHAPGRQFDTEDLRLLESLGHFASAAYQAVESLGEIDQRRAALSLMEDYATVADERLRLLEELKEADRRKDEFLATLAHELRNPLAPVRNAVQVLGMKGSDEPGLRWGREVIERQVTHLTRIVDDLLDVSRITRNKLELRQERTELADVMQGAAETSRPLIDQHRHELTVHLPPEPVYLYADPVRLAQVFMNLLTNAAKYTKPGGRIWFIAERHAGGVIVRVRDNGVGIAADKLPHVFELFFQVTPALERSQGGLGIGLTLVRNLVELHKGTIEARSDGPDKGTEFIVRLPLAETVGKQSKTIEPKTQSHGQVSRYRLLVVDDNQDAADSLGMLLRLQGHDVQVAYSGSATLDIVKEFSPDVVFLDIGMPGMDGYEVARKLREHPSMQKAMLVALTGWGQEGDRQRTAEAGFDRHLVKPLDAKQLQSVLEDVQN